MKHYIHQEFLIYIPPPPKIHQIHNLFFSLHPRTYLLILERGEGTENEKEKNIDLGEKYRYEKRQSVPTGDQTPNLRMCPDYASNL